MISRRSRMSLIQYLDRIEFPTLMTLLRKHDLVNSDRDINGILYAEYGTLTRHLPDIIEPADDARLESLLDEIARTQSDLYAHRGRTNRESYEERYADLTHCLLMDGYTVEHRRFQAIDPSAQDDAGAIEDELTTALRASGLPRADEIVRMLNSSTDGFRRPEPDLNAVLNNARVALQTLATDIAKQRLAQHPAKFKSNEEKWGSLMQYLRESGFVEGREEEGLTGVFTFVSPGSHEPVGFSRTDMARLGRALVFGMCWFLVKRHAAANAPAARGAGAVRDVGF